MKQRALLFSFIPLITVIVQLLLMVSIHPGNDAFKKMTQIGLCIGVFWVPSWTGFLIYSRVKKQQISISTNIIVGILSIVFFGLFFMVCSIGL
jgi:hypothetical protein